MGHGNSMMSNSASFPNLDLKQVEEIKARFGKAGDMKKDVFVAWQTRLGGLAGMMFDALADKGVLKQAVFLEAANKLGGDAEDAVTILLKIHGNTKKMLATVVEFFAETHKSPNGDVLLHFLYKDAPSDDSRLSSYLISTPLAAAIIRSAYSCLWNGNRDDLLPRMAGDSVILTSACSLALINSHLPMERRRIWSLLFSSTQHGSSFSQLNKRISGEGPCLIVVRSTENRVFGCFSSEGFLSGPQYRGDATSFLYQLAPEMNIFFATGKSENYAYLNCQQETLPNGLGIGGSADVWPFFIHEEYGKGLSARSISSFDKCCLSGADTFEIKDMEVWRVGRKRQLTIEEGERVRSPKSIIDKDPEAKALLEMSGRTMHSEAYREPAPILDDEEQWQQ